MSEASGIDDSSRHDTIPGEVPEDSLEQQGIPEMGDSTPAGTDDPERSPDLGAESPTGVDEFGTTAAEEAQGEPLTGRLDREEPDVGEPGAPARPEVDLAGQLVAEDEGTELDTAKDDAADRQVAEAGGFTAAEAAARTEE